MKQSFAGTDEESTHDEHDTERPHHFRDHSCGGARDILSFLVCQWGSGTSRARTSLAQLKVIYGV